MSPFFSLSDKRIYSIRDITVWSVFTKNVLSYSLLLLLPAVLLGQTHIMTFNIRYATEADGIDQWELRKGELVSFLEQEQPDLLGVQEAMPQQVAFLQTGLSNYGHIGHGRDGKNTNSEAVPLFYHKDRYLLLKHRVFWLSPTPEVPSKGWDAALPRIAVYGVFKDLRTSDTIHVINTHFDHMGTEARLRSAHQILQWVQKEIPPKAGVILMGDLNSEPDAAPILALASYFNDVQAGQNSDTPIGTFNAFDTNMSEFPRIDYLFTREFETIHAGVSKARRGNGRYLSDHFPIWAKVIPAGK
ncbi:endonuclease/exonuclease/phosphatase family protein [Robertkochia sediminum]|uniref:endonuclease/exonuclease/phosphatase family protein n=1 Tax=Robertkochia sediminum TaxID=2785326 RepID=UPI0019326B35|nr:endonuclease/exonuclease/phosphatase family protein [Robertkochia sediminum]MBL7473056.1 endonuclease/exonuclease/phosphatase family protein [Robertkochia sediminum]